MPRHFLGRAPFFGDEPSHGDVGAFVPPPLEKLESDTAARRHTARLIAALIGSLIVIAAAIAFCSLRPAHALNHGFDPASPVTKFFDQLKRPYCAPGANVCSCCGKADAYPVMIDQEASLDGDKPDGVAHVIDGAAIVYPDGTQRSFIPDGTVFHFTGRDVTKLKQGNPTKTARAFLGTGLGGQISIVWCVVPLPPGM